MRRIAIFVDQTLEALLNKNKSLFILSLCLAVVYYIVFSIRADFTDTAELARDSWSYQSIAVNYANGHGFHTAGKMGGFEEYKFAGNYNKRYYNKFIVFGGVVDLQRNLGYPLFLSVVYKIFDVSPLIAKYIQLLLLVIVASSLPWIGRYFWGKSGLVSGVIAGTLFLMNNSYVAGQIMSESLMIFTIYLIIVAYINHDFRKSRGSSIIIGLVLGISLLVKGSFIFITPLLVLHLAYQHYIAKGQSPKMNLLLIILFSVLPVLPWTVYVNLKERAVKESLMEVKEVVFNDSLSLAQKRIILDKSSIIMGKGFLPERELSMAEKRTFQDSILPAITKNGFALYDTILNPLDRLALLEQVTGPASINFLRVFVVKHLLLDGHNEYMKDGGWYPEWRSNSESFYNNDGMEDSSSILRVTNFYFHHPSLIFKLMWMKIISAMSQFVFLWLIAILLIVDTLTRVLKRHLKSGVSKIVLLILALPAILFPFYFPVKEGDAGSISLWLLSAFLLLLFTKAQYNSLKAPFIFYSIFVNFLLISVVGIGVERWTMVMDFVIGLIGVYYLIKFVTDNISELRVNGLKS